MGRNVEDVLLNYVKEDMGFGDVTTDLVLGDRYGCEARGCIIAKEACTVAGLEVAGILFSMLGCDVSGLVADGDRVAAGNRVLLVSGPVESLLLGERTALNVISRMSGVATMTGQAIEKARAVNPAVRISATRKTTPGFELFEKMAVLIAGGDTHRMNLSESVLIKDNHVTLVGSAVEAVKLARDGASFVKKIEVEVGTYEEAMECATAGPDIIMLDNFSPWEASRTYKDLKAKYPGILIEVSGGIGPDNVDEYAGDADVISMGGLTHSYRSVDFTMVLESEDGGSS